MDNEYIDFDSFEPSNNKSVKSKVKKKMMIIGVIFLIYTMLGTAGIVYTIINLIK